MKQTNEHTYIKANKQNIIDHLFSQLTWVPWACLHVGSLLLFLPGFTFVQSMLAKQRNKDTTNTFGQIMFAALFAGAHLWTNYVCQTNKQANTETNKQTNEQTNKPPNNLSKHTNEETQQTHKQTKKQNRQTNKQTHKQRNKPTNKHTNKQTNKQATNQPTNQPTNQTNKQQTNKDINKQRHKQTTNLFHLPATSSWPYAWIIASPSGHPPTQANSYDHSTIETFKRTFEQSSSPTIQRSKKRKLLPCSPNLCVYWLLISKQWWRGRWSPIFKTNRYKSIVCLWLGAALNEGGEIFRQFRNLKLDVCNHLKIFYRWNMVWEPQGAHLNLLCVVKWEMRWTLTFACHFLFLWGEIVDTVLGGNKKCCRGVRPELGKLVVVTSLSPLYRRFN